jgi:hypothetical protein
LFRGRFLKWRLCQTARPFLRTEIFLLTFSFSANSLNDHLMISLLAVDLPNHEFCQVGLGKFRTRGCFENWTLNSSCLWTINSKQPNFVVRSKSEVFFNQIMPYEIFFALLAWCSHCSDHRLRPRKRRSWFRISPGVKYIGLNALLCCSLYVIP